MVNGQTKKMKLFKNGQVRVRIAPSPTGLLHIGTARTALFNYLFSKKNDGVFILRIEDTDKARSKEKFERNVIDNLKGLGIQPDEGPEAGGDYGPYRQSERTEIYRKYLNKLLEEGKAYYCFCSSEELKAEKEYQISIGEASHYSGRCASLSKEVIEKNLQKKKPYVIRFRTPPKKVKFGDLIRGGIEFDASLMGDMVIAKNSAEPLYNFACAVDDFEMKISHVIRGEDHLTNTPKQILIQETLGFPRPEYVHLPLILAPDRTKLSKRHGAVAVSEYKAQGYLPEALVNFIAFLGWNPGTEREIFSLSSLVKEFSLERVQKGGAVFNIKRLKFLNKFYIRQKSPEKLAELCLPYLIREGLITPQLEERQYPPAYGGKEIVPNYKVSDTGEAIGAAAIQNIVSIYQERLERLSDITELTDFFFKESLDYEKDLLKWKDMTDKELNLSLDLLEKLLYKIDEKEFSKEKLSDVLVKEAEKLGHKLNKVGDRGVLLWPFRVALTGKRFSASPFEIGEIMGKKRTLKRIKQAKAKLL